LQALVQVVSADWQLAMFCGFAAQAANVVAQALRQAVGTVGTAVGIAGGTAVGTAVGVAALPQPVFGVTAFAAPAAPFVLVVALAPAWPT
jgi:hypothetical protein